MFRSRFVCKYIVISFALSFIENLTESVTITKILNDFSTIKKKLPSLKKQLFEVIVMVRDDFISHNMFDLRQLTTLGVNDIPLWCSVIFFYGVYRLIMTKVILKKIAQICRVKNEMKFVHRLFDLIHYSTSAMLGMSALSTRPYGHCTTWSLNCGDYFMQQEEYIVTYFEKIYFMMFASYYVVDVFYLWTSSDTIMLIAHHCATLSMIFFSVALKVPVLGLVIMLLHDVVDVPLYVGKVLLYLGYEKAKDLCFVAFAILCTWFRMINYPTVVYNAVKNAKDVTFRSPLYNFTCALLCVLYLLHVIWYSQILKIAINGIRGIAITDTRSD